LLGRPRFVVVVALFFTELNATVRRFVLFSMALPRFFVVGVLRFVAMV
jgi:hypothetical protein|tara:strand:+ start:235 stop:378 length:144 start_codon:yes stop_codon:yes gene_type:complete